MQRLELWQRWVSGAVALVVVVWFAVMLAGFHVPAYDGVDENGYFAAARRLALTGHAAKSLANPLEHVSGNVVQTGDNLYYPKYPLGLSWLAAAGYRLGGERGAFWVNPVLATLAVAGIMLLGRDLLGTFAGLAAGLLLASNPLHAVYGNGAVSHAGAICFAVWAMWFLWRWTRDGGWAAALASGALGAAAWTFRYSEALLVLPAVVMVGWRYAHLPEGARPTEGWSARRQWRWEVGWMVAGAGLVAAPLLAHHWVAFGAPWRTGYGLCGESTGFGWEWFRQNWWLMLTRLNTPGLVLLFPLGLVGLAWLMVHDRPRGLLLGLWAVPAILLYTAYYWAPAGEGRSYIRFFVSVFPPLILGALALLLAVGRARTGWTLAVGGFLAVVVSYNLRETLRELDKQRERLAAVRQTWELVRTRVPAGAVALAPESTLNHLEFAGDYELYAADTFSRAAIQRRVKVLEDDRPHPFQRRKARQLAERLGALNDEQLAQMQREFFEAQLTAGRAVVALGTDDQWRAWRGRLGERLAFRPLATWDGPIRRNESRAAAWTLHEVVPRSAVAAAVPAAVALAEKVDRLQFRVQTLRDAFHQKYPGAAQEWATITELERQLRDAREQLRLRQDRRVATNPPARRP